MKKLFGLLVIMLTVSIFNMCAMEYHSDAEGMLSEELMNRVREERQERERERQERILFEQREERQRARREAWRQEREQEGRQAEEEQPTRRRLFQ